MRPTASRLLHSLRTKSELHRFRTWLGILFGSSALSEKTDPTMLARAARERHVSGANHRMLAVPAVPMKADGIPYWRQVFPHARNFYVSTNSKRNALPNQRLVPLNLHKYWHEWMAEILCICTVHLEGTELGEKGLWPPEQRRKPASGLQYSWMTCQLCRWYQTKRGTVHQTPLRIRLISVVVSLEGPSALKFMIDHCGHYGCFHTGRFNCLNSPVAVNGFSCSLAFPLPFRYGLFLWSSQAFRSAPASPTPLSTFSSFAPSQ